MQSGLCHFINSVLKSEILVYEIRPWDRNEWSSFTLTRKYFELYLWELGKSNSNIKGNMQGFVKGEEFCRKQKV